MDINTHLVLCGDSHSGIALSQLRRHSRCWSHGALRPWQTSVVEEEKQWKGKEVEAVEMKVGRLLALR